MRPKDSEYLVPAHEPVDYIRHLEIKQIVKAGGIIVAMTAHAGFSVVAEYGKDLIDRIKQL